MMKLCPCDLGSPSADSPKPARKPAGEKLAPRNFEDCCGRYISGAQAAPTAVALMRSRYSAYVLENEAYLRASWDERTRPADAILADPQEAGQTKWLGLTILRTDAPEQTQQADEGEQATVEFVAKYKIAGRAHRLHEVSRFVRHRGLWFYVDGSFPKK